MFRLILSSLVVFSSPLYAKSPVTSPLNASDPLAILVGETATEFGDDNISTGTTAVGAAKLNDKLPTQDSERQKLVRVLFEQSFKTVLEESLPKNAKVTVTVSKYSSSTINDVARALAEGNAYDPTDKETLDELAGKVSVLLSKLSIDSKTVVGTAKARLESDPSGELRNIFYFVFINPETQKLVKFFVVEGAM